MDTSDTRSASPDLHAPTGTPACRRGLSSFALKLVAIVAMTANHAAYVFWAQLPGWALCVLFACGGLAFPIMAFLLVEGYRHTSSVRRYARRLLVFALAAQVPYALFLGREGNVLFTLLACLGVLWSCDRLAGWRRVAAVAALTAATLPCDWGLLGPVMVLAQRLATSRLGRVASSAVIPVAADGLPALASFVLSPSATGLAVALYPLVGCSASVPLLMAYDGRRGRPLKWFFYAYYPVHIAVLGLAKGLLLGDWATGFAP